MSAKARSKRMGRPPSADPLCERVTVRLTSSEMADLETLADRDTKTTTLSGYLRKIVLDHLKRRRARS